jgi:hypothetical protein
VSASFELQPVLTPHFSLKHFFLLQISCVFVSVYFEKIIYWSLENNKSIWPNDDLL